MPNIAQAIAASIIDFIIDLAGSSFSISSRSSPHIMVAHVSSSSSIMDAAPVRNPQSHSPPLLEKEAPRTPRTARRWLAIVVTRIAVLTPMIIADRVARRSILGSIRRAVLGPDALTITIVAIARQAVIAVGIANGVRSVRTTSVLNGWIRIETPLRADHQGGQQRALDERLEHNLLGSSLPSCSPRACGYKVSNALFRS